MSIRGSECDAHRQDDRPAGALALLPLPSRLVLLPQERARGQRGPTCRSFSTQLISCFLLINLHPPLRLLRHVYTVQREIRKNYASVRHVLGTWKNLQTGQACEGLGPGQRVGERGGNLNAALAGTRTGTGTRSGIPAPAFFDRYPRTTRPRESPMLHPS